ncbi:hypothetical protein AXF42_Ash016995 [Apostasia shenzhenica]|uniref:Uncharacterized protein n=1 Tax=Apostasia shenzhenica TaxID=1088818 RepID=A0A2I0B7H8_9ASPA|nr:hypothetical protein AXF42_Ash016995 [Apostasia shenzhenica]
MPGGGSKVDWVEEGDSSRAGGPSLTTAATSAGSNATRTLPRRAFAFEFEPIAIDRPPPSSPTGGLGGSGQLIRAGPA